MTIKSYLAASYALHMLLTFPFGPTYFTPANKKIKIVNIDKYVTSTQKRIKNKEKKLKHEQTGKVTLLNNQDRVIHTVNSKCLNQYNMYHTTHIHVQ